MAYGPPLVDFSPLANLGNTFLRAREAAQDRARKREMQATLASLGQGDADYDTVGRRLLSLGELQGGLGFMKLGQEQKQLAAQRAADTAALGLIGGGSPSFAPAAGTPRANIDNDTVHVAENEDDVQRLERAMGQRLDPRDVDLINRTVYGEARSETPVGQQAVASVILNRARQSGMTPSDVVLAQNQFEPWNNPQTRAQLQGLDPNSPEYQRIAATVAPVLQGQAPDPTGGATHFYAPRAQAALGRNAPAWDDGTGQDIGNHRFFAHGYGPQSRVQVAQADIPAAGARNVQGFAVPEQGGQPSQLISNLERALAMPNLSDNARRILERRLDRAYKERDEATKLTDEQREYRMAREQGYTGSFMQFKTDLKKAGAVNIQNNVGGDGSPLRKKLDEKEGERWSTLQEAAVTSGALSQDFQVLDELMKVAPQGPIVGQLAEMFPGVSSAGAAFQSIVTRVAPSLRTPGSGATSDVEYEGMLKSLPRLSNRPEANRLIADTMKAKAELNVRRGQIVTDYQNNVIDADEARRQLNELNKVSIMSPELKQLLQSSGSAAVPGFRAQQPGQDGWITGPNGIRIREKR